MRKSYHLNFHGRVSVSSIKNFQLISKKEELKEKNNQENIYIQFGKNGKNQFNLDVSYPFSIYQAFGIAISSIDSKVALS